MMLSILISFRFPDKKACSSEAIRRIKQVFEYWEEKRDQFQLELIFINDHSEKFWLKKSFIYNMPGIKVDWNMASARNYAATLAKGNRLLFTDIDHILSGDLKQLEHIDLTQKYIKFERISLINNEMKHIKHHTNTFLILAKDFIKYDEDFCGNYGHEDTEFFFRLNKTHTMVILSNDIARSYVLKLPRVELDRDKQKNKDRLIFKIKYRQ